VRADFTWQRVTAPLVEFCQNPQAAPDRVADREASERFTRILDMPQGRRRDFALAMYYLRTGGLSRVMQRMGERNRRRSRD